MPVVPDASPLIALSKLDQVGLLPVLYGRAFITPWVWREAVTEGKKRGAPDAGRLERQCVGTGFLKASISQREARLVSDLQSAIGFGVGEAEVLAVAKARKCLVVLDDKQARMVAASLGVMCTGTLGVLYEAFRLKRLSYERFLALLEDLSRTLWISPDLLAAVIRRAREETGK